VQPPPIEPEFDGTATDISDVAIADFPVLTDAVELPPAPAPSKWTAPAQPELAARARAPRPAPPPRPIAAPQPPPVAPARVETAYAAPKTAPPVAPKPAAAAPAAPAPKPAAPPRNEPVDDDDLLRQTQTMRAIAVAKSIDDISSSMAETLFGDAELDLVTAALASAAEWPDDDALEAPAASKPDAAKAAGKAEPAKPAANAEATKPAPPVDDPFDLFGLGDDAPLELIDDSTLPPIAPKRATR
jgi:hypothetical protein